MFSPHRIEGDEATLRRAHVSVERSVTPIFWVRSDASFAYANPAARALLGYSLEELLGMGVDDIDLHWPADYWEEEGYQRLRAAGVDTFETELRRKTGDIVPVEITSNHVEVDDQELIFAFVVDISERKQGESELAEALEEIASLKDKLQAENVYLREEIRTVHGFDEIVGASDALRGVLHQVAQVAGTDATVLILGETGTGKELVARAIHDRSRRADRPLVKVNCAALPGSLIESELFGHEKGAFTGAISRREGRFSLADGGTIFLDEIGDLSPEVQAKLLRVLQEGEFEPLGSSRSRTVDVRVIAATNRDLEAAMERDAFRPDLFFRLSVFPIQLPPLRERPEDIPLLVRAFVRRNEHRLGKRIESIPASAMDRLTRYPWPGNVRELENVIQRALIFSQDETLAVPDLQRATGSAPDDRWRSLAEVEHDHIRRVLESTDWRIKGEGGAADRLDLPPSTLRYRMKKLGIMRP